ncbi:MAG: hypothetical protein ACR2OR_00570 [Hyphomicrobiales bacterium]
MPLQNRVDPYGHIHADAARGLFFGNRGGRFHRPDKTLTSRRWANRAWISCVLEFKQRQRQVMSPGSYTELFFLDEVTALSAGHRPCFECRYKRANEFLRLYATSRGEKQRPYAGEFDKIAHAARLNGRKKRTYSASISSLPNGTMIVHEGTPHAVYEENLLAWSFSGYTTAEHRPHSGRVEVLTPEPFVEILTAGYEPVFHPSAGICSAKTY